MCSPDNMTKSSSVWELQNESPFSHLSMLNNCSDVKMLMQENVTGASKKVLYVGS